MYNYKEKVTNVISNYGNSFIYNAVSHKSLNNHLQGYLLKIKTSTYSGPLESHTQCATTTVPGGRLLPNRRQGGVHKDRPIKKKEQL